jgi:hypothetical protein
LAAIAEAMTMEKRAAAVADIRSVTVRQERIGLHMADAS